MRYYFLSLLCLIMAVACTSNTAESSQDTVEDVSDDFLPEGGMTLQSLASIPGVSWSLDTIKGICSPDTLLLWASYQGTDYMTNVYGVDGRFALLTPQGAKKVKLNPEPELQKTDFQSHAMVTTKLGLDRAQYKVLRDSMYAEGLDAVKTLVRDFFLSGDVKYMAEPMASHWRAIYEHAAVGDDDSSNPFNGKSYVEFSTKSISASVTDANNGVVEVMAYCLDPLTLGAPGWGYWTVLVCRQNGLLKIKETPAQHRRFVTG